MVPAGIQHALEDIAAGLVEEGYIIATGNADGSDAAFARGGNRVDPTRVHLFLPWPEYNKHLIHPSNVVSVLSPSDLEEFRPVVERIHPYPERLKESHIRLHARNILILRNARACLCYQAKRSGGTQFGIDYARSVGIPVLNLYDPVVLERVLRRLKLR